ncbi:hypothetical protein N2152v2_009427 [Parachlorella kessleri]
MEREAAHPRRVAKVAKQIEREVGELLVHDKVMQQAICPERKAGFDTYMSAVASVTEVQLSNDLQVAKVYISVYSDDVGKAVAMQSLHRLAGYVRKHVGQKVRLRLTPEIRFVMDDSIERSLRVEALLKQMEQIRLGQAEPPPIALPEDSDDEDDLSDDEDGPPGAGARAIGSVDLGFFGGQRPQQPQSEGGGRAQQQQQGAGRGPATRATAGKQRPRQQQQLRQQAEDNGGLPDLEGEELDDEEVERMLQAFRKQRELEEKGRASRAKGQ